MCSSPEGRYPENEKAQNLFYSSLWKSNEALNIAANDLNPPDTAYTPADEDAVRCTDITQTPTLKLNVSQITMLLQKEKAPHIMAQSEGTFAKPHIEASSFDIRPKFTLSQKNKRNIPYNTGSQFLGMPLATGERDTPTGLHTPIQSEQMEHQSNAAIWHMHTGLHTEEAISLLNTASMFAVNTRGIDLQQQDIFTNNLVEDITRQATLRLPIATLTAEKLTQIDQSQMVISTASGAAIAGAGDLISAALRFVTNIVMTHIVSTSIYGAFIAAYTSVTIAGWSAKLGLDSTVIRFLSTYRVKGEHRLAVGLVRFAIWITLISGFICGILFYFSSTILARFVYHQDTYELPLKEVALLVPLIALQLTLASGLWALKEIKWKVYVDRLIQPALTLILLGIFYLLGLRLEALILATICGFLASTIAGKIFLGKGMKDLVHDTPAAFESKVWIRFSLPMFFNSMIRGILNSTDILFLAAFALPAAVGIYGVADRMSVFVLMPLGALNIIFSPMITDYYARNAHTQLASMFKTVSKWSISLSLPVFLCFFIFHDAILGVFNKDYMAGSTVLIILSLGNLIDAGTGSVEQLLGMTGRPRVILANTVTTVIANVGLAFLLVPRFGIIGAAVAASLAVIILNTLCLIEVYWIMRIQPYRWDLLKPAVAGGVASAVGLVLLRLIHIDYGYAAIPGTLALVTAFTLVYVLILIVLRFSEEDLMVLHAIRAKLGNKK
jgi:O-antigen/teichoic acid export membrane protein